MTQPNYDFDVVVPQELETFITKALEQLSGPNRGWKFNRYSDGRQQIQQFDISEGLLPLTKEEIFAKAEELFDEFTLIKYQFDRQKNYPAVGDQLDAIYHYFSDQGITNTFTEMIDQVKQQFPKP